MVRRVSAVRLTSARDVARALTPLAGVPGALFFGVLWVLRGDLEYFNVDYFLPNPNSNSPCCLCPADVETMHEYRTGRIQWLRQIYTRAQFFCTEFCTHLLFHRVHAGISSLTIVPDLLHAKHLGTDQYFYASVIWLLVFVVLGTGDAAGNLEEVVRQIKRAYDELSVPIRFQNITLRMFWDRKDPPKAYPQLKGRGAECRHPGVALQNVWEDNMDVADAHHVHIHIALKCSVRIERILTDNKDCFRFPALVATEFKDKIFEFLIVFNELAAHFFWSVGSEAFRY